MKNKNDAVEANLTERLRALRDVLTTGLVERDEAIRLALLAALAGEHLLLIGPPGTAKSLLARRLGLAIRGGACFERLLTRFSVPEELFGPLSIKGLEEDRYERLTDGYLPQATVAFLDEVFKANSAILNALLTLLNEREFDNGRQRVRTPLVCVVGASNELAEGEELDALYDRFLLRLYVGPVSDAGLGKLLALRGDDAPDPGDELRLAPDELEAIQKDAEQVRVPDDVLDLLFRLRTLLAEQETPASDRRWRKVLQLLQVSAFTNGRDEVSSWDCWLLQHCTWSEPEQREAVYEWYAERVGATAAMDPARLTRLVTAWESKLAADEESQSQARDCDGRLLFLDDEGSPTACREAERQRRRDGEPLYLAPEGARLGEGYRSNPAERSNGQQGFTRAELDKLVVDDRGRPVRIARWSGRDAYLGKRANWFPERTDLAPMMEPTRHKPAYVADCLDQIDAIAGDVQRYAGRLDDHLSALKATISSHLWVTPDFVGPATSSLEETRGTVSSLSSRIDRLRTGFESLPQDGDAAIFAGGDGLDEAAEDVPLEEDAAAGRPRRPRRRYVRT